MPWLALPYSNRDLKDKLSKQFKVQGIPTLVILDGEGNLITKNGRAKVSSDSEFKNYPWKPIPTDKCLAKLIQTVDSKDEVGCEHLKGKTIGLYFSAHWCGPCRQFTPELAKYYKKMKELKKPFEIVFCSSDRDQKSFDEYYKTMPWMAIPYKYRDMKDALSERFGIRGIPALIIVDENFDVITANGRGIPTSDPEGKKFPWIPEPVNDLSSPEGIDESPSLVVFMENEKDEKKTTEYQSIMTKIAKPYQVRGKDPEFRFFIETKTSGVGGKVRSLTGNGKALGLLVLLLDLEDRGGYYKFEGDFTEDNMNKFLTDYKAKNR
eukprot:UN06581